MDKIIIKRNTNGDTRVAKKTPMYHDFVESNEQHINDVRQLMTFISRQIYAAGEMHDHTKITHSRLFFKDFADAMAGRINFEDGEWYPMHYTAERHHLNKHVPMDVNLIDVIEMVADCICAGLVRSGEFTPIDMDPDILMKAFNNTVEMMLTICEVEKGSSLDQQKIRDLALGKVSPTL